MFTEKKKTVSHVCYDYQISIVSIVSYGSANDIKFNYSLVLKYSKIFQIAFILMILIFFFIRHIVHAKIHIH